MKSFKNLFSFLAITGSLLLIDIMAVAATPVPSEDMATTSDVKAEAQSSDLFPFGFGYGYYYRRETDADMSADDNDEVAESKLWPFSGYGGYGHRHNRYGLWFRRGTDADMSADDSGEAAESKLWPFSGYYGYRNSIFDRPGHFYRREVADSADTSAEAAYRPYRYGYRHRHYRRPHY
ncbi:hypothetical protein CVT25_013158 [Psilocybe cyanescens]|uniref:Uncharacterized protein n=1 Tax=Psilocybe cyanescens TaxID=93625 RepID=A0A409XK50_PSICY|nr:hypothetical protein CVT25_013158 [Psilocybe cyanescens]